MTVSLFRQLWLVVVVSTLIAFSGSFVVSMFTARNYLQQQLFTQSTDSAASLALSMSQQKKDPATVELLVSALFDNGHFRLVRYSDVHGKTLVERVNRTPPDKVPEWFVRLFPLDAGQGVAQVSDGWMQSGSVTIIAHTRFAYQALWDGALKLFLWILIAGVLTGLMGSALLRTIQRPMRRVVEQARAITERRFITIPEPRTPELRSLAQAMNRMVTQVKAMFAEQASRIEQLRQEANNDALTGLANRDYFESRLRSALHDDDAPPTGALLLIRLFDLAGINQRLGRDRTDQLLREAADRIRESAAEDDERLLARLNGADFALLDLRADVSETRHLAQQILDRLTDLYRQGLTDQDNVAHIGFTLYQHEDDPAQLWQQVSEALAQAQATGANQARQAEQADRARMLDVAHWQPRLEQALQQQHFALGQFPVLNMQGERLHDELMLRLRDLESDGLLPAGRFMPAAARLGLIPQLDLEVVRLALQHVKQARQPVAINLAAESVLSTEFQGKLLLQLNQHSREAKYLWFEVNEHGFRDELQALGQLATRLRPLGCKVGIEHFGRHFNSIPRLHELGLDYLKVDGSFIHQIHDNRGNQLLVKAIADIANNLGIITIAERVESEQEWQALQALGIQGVTGPAATRHGG